MTACRAIALLRRRLGEVRMHGGGLRSNIGATRDKPSSQGPVRKRGHAENVTVRARRSGLQTAHWDSLRRFRGRMAARYTLIVGTKDWSSWSLRPYMAMRATGAPFEEIADPAAPGEPDGRRDQAILQGGARAGPARSRRMGAR